MREAINERKREGEGRYSTVKEGCGGTLEGNGPLPLPP